MIERSQLITEFRECGVLGAIGWAYNSACDRVLADYSAAAGHDKTWIGVSRYTLLRDRLDRVFSCGDYSVPAEVNGELGLDVLHAELSDRDISTFPDLDPAMVSRADLSGSPGWSCGGVRWLLASASFGKLDELPWPQKSPTKQRVAQQPSMHSEDPTLFDDFSEEELGGLVAVMADPQIAMQTVIVAHSLDVDSNGRELVLGQSRLNSRGGSAWHWRHDLLQLPPSDGERLRPAGPSPVDPEDTPDAPVRLRRAERGQRNRRKEAK